MTIETEYTDNAGTGNTYTENTNFDDGSKSEDSMFLERLIKAGVPADLVVNVIDMISEITARTGYLDTSALEAFIDYFEKNTVAVQNAVKRTHMCIQAIRDFYANVYPDPEVIPTYANEIPALDIDSLGIPETNVIMKFFRYGNGITDTYPEYILQSGVSAIGTIVQRRLYAHLNGRKIYTNLWLGNLGLSGYARKSAAMSLVRKLVENSCGNLYLPADLNPVSMLENMASEILEKKVDPKTQESKVIARKLTIVDDRFNISRSQRTFIKDEVGQLLAQINKPSHTEMKETFLILHSGDDYDRETVTKKVIIKEPYFSLYWATTIDSAKKHLTKEDISSGWLARMLIVNPTYQKQRIPITEGNADSPENLELQQEIEKDLATINKTLKYSVATCADRNRHIKVLFQAGVLQLLEDWVSEREMYYAKGHDELMSAFTARFQENAVRLSILVELGNIPELLKGKWEKHQILEFKISKASMQSALKMIDCLYLPYAMKLATELSIDNASTAQTGVSKAINKVETQLAKNLKMDLRTCMRNCSLKKADFEECIESLEYVGAVKHAKVVVSQNKLQSWLVHVPAERRTVIFKHNYDKFKVDPYETGIRLDTYFDFGDCRKNNCNGLDLSDVEPPKSTEPTGIDEFLEPPKSTEEILDSMIPDGIEVIETEEDLFADEDDSVSSKNPDW